jgi:hypothetical protein
MEDSKIATEFTPGIPLFLATKRSVCFFFGKNPKKVSVTKIDKGEQLQFWSPKHSIFI